MTLEHFQKRHRSLLERLYSQTTASQWGLDVRAFCAAVHLSWEKQGSPEQAEQYIVSLRIRDLVLAAACANGSEPAWQQFFQEMREPLRSAGRSLAGSGGDELADSLFGELFEERAKLRSFGGRSSLTGWLRAVLYQTYIDRLRATKKEVSLEEREEAGAPMPVAPVAADPVETSEYGRIAQAALENALAKLPPRQKLILDFYYFHSLTLREAAALVGVHEATASRELDRARAQLRKHLTDILKQQHKLKDEEVSRCLLEAAGGALEIAGTLQEKAAPIVQK